MADYDERRRSRDRYRESEDRERWRLVEDREPYRDHGRRDYYTDRDQGVPRYGGVRSYRGEPGYLSDYRPARRGGEPYRGGYDRNRERDYGDHSRAVYGRYDERRRDYGGRDLEERGFFERAGDEIATWFGSEEAERRREWDARHGDEGARHHIGKGPRGYTRSDDRIREDVNDRLTDDPLVDATDIDVTVQNGDVTLNGTVDSRSAKRRAEDIADSVSGVRHTQNNLRVKAWGAGTVTPGSPGVSGAL